MDQDTSIEIPTGLFNGIFKTTLSTVTWSIVRVAETSINELLISDIKLQTYIQQGTGVSLETAEIDQDLLPLNTLRISDLKLNTYISETRELNAEIEDTLPRFSVLSINDMKINAIIEDKFRTDLSSTFPTGLAFDWTN